MYVAGCVWRGYLLVILTCSKRKSKILINLIIHSCIYLIHTFIEDIEYDRNYARSGENKNKKNVYLISVVNNSGMWKWDIISINFKNEWNGNTWEDSERKWKSKVLCPCSWLEIIMLNKFPVAVFDFRNNIWSTVRNTRPPTTHKAFSEV